MNDDSTLGAVRDSLTTAKNALTEDHMSTPLDTIVRHGRATRRRHRLIGLAGTGAVAVTAALAVGLTGATSPAPHPGTISTTAFTLVSNANGTVTLTINPRVLLDPGTLQRDLKRDGIPAIVTVGSFCTSNPAPAGFLRVVSFTVGQHPTITFHPAAMPAGAELSFGDFQLAANPQAYFTLISTGSHACASAPTNLHGAVVSLTLAPRA
jgi:hypothetical protein